MPFQSPNFTQMPNDLLGDQATPGLMATLKYAELKVILAICRLTFGYHRKVVRASLTTLEKMTGLTSASILKAAENLEQMGMIFRDSARGVTCWYVLTEEAGIPTEPPQEAGGIATIPPEPPAGIATIPPSMKENSKEKEKPCATTSRAPIPPAVAVFRSETQRFPAKSWFAQIAEAVGEKPEDLERWRAVCHDYVGLGWSQVNVKAMLEFYGRNEIPGSNGRYKSKPVSDEPAGFAGIREYKRQLEMKEAVR
jgi:phage replication O-like protein O